jgi:tartrate dehydratase beta subunit/fumarate hydratase class I family protein
MPTTISAPLSSREVARLRAGDDVLITAQLLLLAIDEDEDTGQNDDLPPTMIEGRICCLATDRSENIGDPRWRIARIDAPAVDRVACSLLAAGARACIARGRCSAALSYALRKYRGLYFAVDADWLQHSVASQAIVAQDGSLGRITHSVIAVEHVPLTVTHDSQGHDLGVPV